MTVSVVIKVAKFENWLVADTAVPVWSAPTAPDSLPPVAPGLRQLGTRYWPLQDFVPRAIVPCLLVRFIDVSVDPQTVHEKRMGAFALRCDNRGAMSSPFTEWDVRLSLSSPREPATLFTDLHVHHAFVIVAAVLLTAAIFALGGFINAVFAKNFDQANWVPTFVLTPLTYFGGVFYSVSLLPAWAQKVSFANPVLHMVNAFRYGFLGTSDVDVGLAFGIMALAAAVLFYVAVELMNRGIGMRD